jgi:hypothetical protein
VDEDQIMDVLAHFELLRCRVAAMRGTPRRVTEPVGTTVRRPGAPAQAQESLFELP